MYVTQCNNTREVLERKDGDDVLIKEQTPHEKTIQFKFEEIAFNPEMRTRARTYEEKGYKVLDDNDPKYWTLVKN